MLLSDLFSSRSSFSVLDFFRWEVDVVGVLQGGAGDLELVFTIIFHFKFRQFSLFFYTVV